MSGLGVRRVTRSFGDKTVLDNVDFAVAPGEIVGLVGENGAGKTTLLRVLAGFLAQDSGDVLIDDEPVRLRGPRDATARGVGMVHQHFLLIPELTVAENVVLGREPGAGPLLDLAIARRDVRQCAERFGLDVDPDARVADLGVAARQRVELLKVLVRGARFLLLDEPTGLLPPQGVLELFELVRGLAAGGCGVVLVTHRLREVFALCSRATVLRRGRVAGTRDVADTSERDLAQLMVGDDLGNLASTRERRAPGDVVLAVERLSVAGRGAAPAVDDASLELRAHEIVGIAGVAGSGQRELLEALAGVVTSTGAVRLGDVVLAGPDGAGLDVAARRRAGLGLVPEDRQEDGLVGGLGIHENLVLGAAPTRGFVRRGWIARARVGREGSDVVREFDVRPPDPRLDAAALSGGNQQKVLLARELRAAPRVLLASEPARGLDFRATAAVHARLRALADGGGAVLVAGTDLAELLEICDRIVVMFAGRIVGEVRPGADAEARIGLLMAGAGS